MTLQAEAPTEMEIELEAAMPAGNETLRSRAVRSSGWTLASYAGGTLIRIVSTMALTRLLLPNVFGLNTIVWIFIQGLHMFSDVGIGPSVIQNARGDEPDFLNTAWTIQSLRGTALFICSLVIAFPVAAYYHIPELRWLIPAAGFTAIIDGFTSTKYYTRSRHLSLKGITAMDLGTSIVQLVITLVWAKFSPTVWALVAGSIASSLLKTLLTHFALPGIQNRFRWSREAVDSLVRFGRWIFVSTLLTFMAMQCDKLLFAGKIPLDLLGIYGIALNLASMPKEAILRIAGPITFSLYSRLGTSRESVASAFGKVRGPLLVIGAWGLCGLIVTGPAIVHILYPKGYFAAGWLLQVLAISAWFEILETTNGSALLALGVTKWIAAANAAKLIVMAALIPVAFALGAHYGINGFHLALVAVVLSEVARFAVSAIGVIQERVGAVWRDLGVTCMFLVTAALGYYIEQRLPQMGSGRFAPILTALVASVVVSLPWAPLALLAVRSLRPGRGADAGLGLDAPIPATV